jgi:hypothetical protein
MGLKIIWFLCQNRKWHKTYSLKISIKYKIKMNQNSTTINIIPTKKKESSEILNLIRIFYKTPKNIIGRTSFKKIQSFIEKPDCQRSIDDEHVNKLLSYQIKHYEKYKEFFFPRQIIIGLLNNKFYVMDGQHRLHCIKYLVTKYQKDIELNVSILILKDECELDEKFLAINQNTPVPIVANDINGWKEFDRHIEQYLRTNFGKYIKKSKNPYSPNFNITNLFEYMKKHRVSQRLKNDHKIFLAELDNLNRYYRQTYTTSLIHMKGNIFKKILKTKEIQKDNPLFVTLFKNFEWVNRIVYKLETGKNYENMVHVDCNYRKRITKNLRLSVWSKRFETSMVGNCYVCLRSLNYDDFECGHVDSVFYGGKTNLNNLEPICGGCNRDMGIQNLEEYKKQMEEEFK